MSAEAELKKAQATGVTISKDKLANIIKSSSQPRYPVLREKANQDYVILLLPKSAY